MRARKLVWARDYAKRITEKVSSNPNRDVLDRWKYAQALVHVGDDQTALQFRRHLQRVKMPASYQRFLIKTTEKLEQNWERCRSKWPEPMFAGQASFPLGRESSSLMGMNGRYDTQCGEILIWNGPMYSLSRVPQIYLARQDEPIYWARSLLFFFRTERLRKSSFIESKTNSAWTSVDKWLPALIELHFQGALPANTGQKLRFTGITVLQVVNGRIVEERGSTIASGRSGIRLNRDWYGNATDVLLSAGNQP